MSARHRLVSRIIDCPLNPLPFAPLEPRPTSLPVEVAVLIPARRASTRLPEKLLLAEHGEPLITTAAKRAALAFGAEHVIVCADDAALITAAQAAGVQAKLTRLTHASGTDRIAEIAAGLNAEIIVNVQGDEPEMEPEHIRLVAELLRRHPWAGMATLCTPGGAAEQVDPNKVKVVLGHTGVGYGEGRLDRTRGTMASAIPRSFDQAPSHEEGRALWFTRAPAPWDRDAGAPVARCYRHLGIYAYRRDVLLAYSTLPASRLEQSEKLEQLRALEAGIGIACAIVTQSTPGIDIRSDYDAFLTRTRR